MSLKAKTVPPTKIPMSMINVATRFMSSSYDVFSIDPSISSFPKPQCEYGTLEISSAPLVLSNLPNAASALQESRRDDALPKKKDPGSRGRIQKLLSRISAAAANRSSAASPLLSLSPLVCANRPVPAPTALAAAIALFMNQRRFEFSPRA
jgi:hypothetical protein